MTKLLYLGGLPRSGSTLLVNVLGQNPDMHPSATSGLADILVSMRQVATNGESFRAQDEDEMNARFANAARMMMLGWAMPVDASTTDHPSYYLDKSRAWIQFFELLRDIDPEQKPPKIIVPVRDLRGVISSMEKLYRKNALKAQQVDNLLTTEARANVWLSQAPVGVALARIKDIFTRGVAGGCLFVRMEDFIANPDKELDGIYEYLGLERYAHDLDKIEQLTREDDRVYGIPGLHDVQEELQPVAEDWVQVLGAGLAAGIKQNHPWFFQQFYPERL